MNVKRTGPEFKPNACYLCSNSIIMPENWWLEIVKHIRLLSATFCALCDIIREKTHDIGLLCGGLAVNSGSS
jgi:hypothetical protein